MKHIRFYPYKMGSQGVSRLAETMRGPDVKAFKVYPDRGYQPKDYHLIVNWGNGAHPRWLGRYTPILNKPDAVSVAGNKLEAFRAMQRAGVQVPDFTTNRGEANGWLQEGHDVVARSVLRGHSGQGITIHTGNSELPQVPLYVRYMKKKSEYRVHVFRGEVIDIQEKRKRQETPNEQVNYQVRNHHNGWVFCRDGINLPSADIREQSIAAVAALGLDFGAVDVIWNDHHKTVHVLEVNTAPGLEGTTLTTYANKIKELARDVRMPVTPKLRRSSTPRKGNSQTTSGRTRRRTATTTTQRRRYA